jgi:uncharacterized protein (DUF58 family)
LKAGDQVSLITFSHDVQMPVPMGPGGVHVRNALAALSGSGPTALRDAVHLAIASQADQRTRSMVLLFSDGVDTASWMPVEELLLAARHSSTVIHIVHFPTDTRAVLGPLAEATGGRTWAAGSDDDLEELFTRALNEMRARYVLIYTPTGEQKRGRHAIEVSLKDARGDVTARSGYIVP